MEQRQLETSIDCSGRSFFAAEVKRIPGYRKLTSNSFLRNNKATPPRSKYLSQKLSQKAKSKKQKKLKSKKKIKAKIAK